MAVVVDSTPFALMEQRLQQQAQESERRLRAEFKAELHAEKERRLKAEHTQEQLLSILRQYQEKSASKSNNGEDHDCFDTMAEERLNPQLMEEMCLMAAPQDSGTTRQSSRQILLDGGSYKSLEHMSQAQLEGLEFDYKDIPQDMWGVAIMTMTRDLADMFGGQDSCSHALRFFYCMGCVAVNLTLQVSILLWVKKYVVGASVFTIQGNYAQFHQDIFDEEGRFKEEAWVKWDGPRDDLCGAVMTKQVFLGFILFLWIGRMLGEIKACIRLWGDVSSLPSVPSDATLSHTVMERNDQHEIIGMSCGTRFFMYIFVAIPKFFIAILLMLIGLQWLTATENFADLILNALALEFIIGIDELVLEIFLPVRCTTNLSKTKFAYPSQGPQTDAQEMAAMVKDYRRNIFYFCLAVGSTYGFLQYAQQVLPHFSPDIAEHCGAWFEHRFLPQCKYFEKGCFPFGNTKSAHNYGAMDAH